MHGNELGQAARLGLRRHEIHVTARIDTGGERRVEAQPDGDAAGILASQRAQCVLILLFARADDDELDLALHQALADVAQQVDALVPGQTRDHTEDGSVRVGAQAHLLAQGALVDPFAVHIGGGIVRAQGAVRLGVKDVGVDAVRNAPQPRIAQHAVETVGIVWVAQLLGIGLRDRRDDVRKLDGALHHVDRAVERQARAVFIRQTENIVEERRIGPALILHVVDGEDELRLRAPVMVQRAQIRRRHGRLPVVAVQDIGLEVEEVQRGHHGL